MAEANRAKRAPVGTKRSSARRETGVPSRAAPRDAPQAPLHDLLSEPLIGVRSGSSRDLRSLPEVLEALGADRVESFPGLQAFQQHAWHAFLVQLAAVALHHEGETSPNQSASRWEGLLLALTGGKREPWCLVVGDLSKPAFMQPPVPEGSLAEFKNVVVRPDLLDVLVLSKNHDVKAGRIWHPAPEHWIYALVSMQTMQGYSGRRNYGIARMNGGYGSRPGVGLATGCELGRRFARDVRVLLDARDEVVKQHRHYRRTRGHALLWLLPWDGLPKSSVPLDSLDPYFIEVCRRVRLTAKDGSLAALIRPTEAPRLAGEELKGVTGDPWTPINRERNVAFTASDSGFSYRVVQRLLGDEFKLGSAAAPERIDGDSLLIAEVMVRGDGQTNGYHSRTIPVPARAIRWLRRPSDRERVSTAARERVEIAADVAHRVLRPALLTLVQGDPKKLSFDDERPRRWVDAFDAAVDVEFFERLWADLDLPSDEGRKAWTERVLELARHQFVRALDDAPVPDARRYRAIAAAERVFEGAKRNAFKHMFDDEGARA